MVGAVSYVALVRLGFGYFPQVSRIVVLKLAGFVSRIKNKGTVFHHHANAHAKVVVNRAHPTGAVARQVVVRCNKVYAVSGQTI